MKELSPEEALRGLKTIDFDLIMGGPGVYPIQEYILRETKRIRNLVESWRIEKDWINYIATQLEEIQNWVLKIHESFKNFDKDPTKTGDYIDIDLNNHAFTWIKKLIKDIKDLKESNETFKLLLSHNVAWAMSKLSSSFDLIATLQWKIRKDDLKLLLGIIDDNLYSFCIGFYSLYHWVEWDSELIINFNLKRSLIQLEKSMSWFKNDIPKLVSLDEDLIPDCMIEWKLWTLLNAISNIIRNAKKHWGADGVFLSYTQDWGQLILTIEDDWSWITNSELIVDINRMFGSGFSGWGSTWVWLALLPQQLSEFWATINVSDKWSCWWVKFVISLPICQWAS